MEEVFWHGTPSGDLRGGSSGLHVGTAQAAKEALEARIGIPVEGSWDGTKEYGKTLLAGKRTMTEREDMITGLNCDAPNEDYYPTGKARYGDSTTVSLFIQPDIIPVHITGKMTNTPRNAYEDFKAGGYMSAQLKRGQARSGYYYINVGEDAGSISAVLPNAQHIEKLN